MKKSLHKFSFLLGLMLLLVGTSYSQNGEVILVEPENIDDFVCEVGVTNTFIWKYNFTRDGFDKECDDVDPASIMLTFDNPESIEIVGGPSSSGCFISLNFKCLDDTPLGFTLCANSADPFQANGTDSGPEDDGIGCFALSPTSVPVEMTFFNGNVDNGRVVLNWQTASEVDNEGFEVQKSTNGSEFSELGFVNSTRSSGIKNYRFVDNNPSVGVSYYRLKQMDYNGNFEYSETIAVKNSRKASPISLYPNPISLNEPITVFIDSNDSQTTDVSVISITGKVISKTPHVLNTGQNKIRIDNSKLMKGMYIISAEIGDTVYNKRLIIQ